jgi:hypothetical protein
MAAESKTAGRPGPYLPQIPATTRTFLHSTLANRSAAGPYSLSSVRPAKASNAKSHEKPQEKS